MTAEHLHPQEHGSTRGSTRSNAVDPIPSPATIERLFVERQDMFASFERYVPVSFRERVREKLVLEKQVLTDLVERQRALRLRAQKAIHVLHKSYFKQKKLDTSSFE